MQDKDTNFDAAAIHMNVMISLLMRILSGTSSEMRKLRDQIVYLNGFGMVPRDIASILGKTENHIRKELSVIKKSK